jgi:hypothetical protein
MSVRKKVFYAWLFVVVTFFGAAMFDVRFFLYVGPILVLGAGIYTTTLRCPNCSQSIYKRRKKLWGMEAIYYGGNPVPRRCSWCGQDLSQTTKVASSCVANE